MLIPAIDLQGGRVVQLVQGERVAIESDDLEGWIARFLGFPLVQVIDLDAARGEGGNAALVSSICERLPCRVGGGIRSIDSATGLLASGARQVILGSALFDTGGVNRRFAEAAANEVGADRLVGAVDARNGHVVIHGWRTRLDLSPEEAVRDLEPFVGGFLFTNVDKEGLMQGIDREAVLRVRNATIRKVTAAGGVTTREEVDWLEGIGVDAVAGMAVYTGRLKIAPP
jgi:phosphoribosylformimino-5-aminoimidazole carboxamide ribotide isomerase